MNNVPASVMKSIKAKLRAKKREEKRSTPGLYRGQATVEGALIEQAIEKPKRAKTKKALRKYLLAQCEDACKTYIKARDAEKTGGYCVFNSVFGCGKPIQCWFHMVKQSRSLMVRFDERNIFGACSSCNWKMELGEGWAWQFYIKTYGQEQMDEILRLSHQTANFSLADLEGIVQYYREKLTSIK